MLSGTMGGSLPTLRVTFPVTLGLRAEFGAPEGFTAPETRANHLNFPIFANRHFTHNGIYRLSDAFMKPAT